MRPGASESAVSDSAVQPLFDFVQSGQLKLCADSESVRAMDAIRHFDWDRIGEINFGLTESVMHALRSQRTHATDINLVGSSLAQDITV
ncbi:unnamed protein product [Echinostoma caproni]|uniref:Uncharacterized protein n=1 Tax=Echinostoma caproni TaxID=27848 RepID=A0A3P8D1C1_9TREM|nr:unnamed protein product [Echinostoma caproni]